MRVLARQTIYTLLHGDGGGAPASWAALLFKRLMGAEALAVANASALGGADVRVFAHRGGAGCGAPPCVAAVVLNAGDAPASVAVDVAGGAPCASRAEFAFAPGPDTPGGEATALINGEAPQFAPGSSELPEIAPAPRRCDEAILVPSKSFSFLAL